MRRIFLAALPAVLFIGALMALNGNVPPAPKETPAAPPPPYTPPADSTPPAVAGDANATGPGLAHPPAEAPAPAPPPLPTKKAAYASVRECSDGSGTSAYEYDGRVQIQPAGGGSAQCPSPLVVIEDGRRYFGCADGGKIILDCDWFVQTIGAENQGQNAVFGSSYLEDFSAPDTSGFSCKDAMVDQDLLLEPDGTVCDLQTLVGNIVQAHGG